MERAGAKSKRQVKERESRVEKTGDANRGEERKEERRGEERRREEKQR
jgi:hypothetical protein